MGFLDRFRKGSRGGCTRCRGQALRTHEFEAQCEAAGFVKDAATGQYKMKVGGLAGTAAQVSEAFGRQTSTQQESYDTIESRRGYQCTGCASVYCLTCLFNHAPPHANGGKACPRCGAIFRHYD